MLAVQAAERREQARAQGLENSRFDGSIIALRKFTSTELLHSGFNISMVAQRQGHFGGHSVGELLLVGSFVAQASVPASQLGLTTRRAPSPIRKRADETAAVWV